MTATAINPAAPPSNQRIIRSILVVMAGFVLTKGVSLLQTLIIADRFGAGAEYDTFVQGNTLPDYIIKLIGGGALGVAFIPVFSSLLNTEDRDKAWQLASQVFNTLLLVTLAFSGFVMIAAPVLVNNIVAPGMSDADAQQTAEIMRILSVGTIIFCLSGIISGILHGHNHFFLPVLAPIFQDLGLLFGVIFFTDRWGIHGLAWGTLLGAILHFSIQIPGLIMFKFQWKRVLGWNDPTLRQVLRLMLPRMLIGGTFLVDLVVIGNINSRLGEGAASAFSWGLRFIDIPQALLGTAVGIVIFPTLSALTSMGRIDERKATFSGALRFMLVSTIPATAGLVLVSYPALRILFTADESARIFTVIQVMSAAIIVQSLHEVLTRAFYADKDTVTPMIFALIGSAVTLTTVLGFYQLYLINEPPLWSPLAVGGPALGYVMTFLVEVILLGYMLRRQWGDIALPELLSTTRKTIAATAIMIVVTLLMDQMLQAAGFGDYTRPKIVIRLAVLVATGGLTFLAAGFWLQIEELRELLRIIRRRKAL